LDRVLYFNILCASLDYSTPTSEAIFAIASGKQTIDLENYCPISEVFLKKINESIKNEGKEIVANKTQEFFYKNTEKMV